MLQDRGRGGEGVWRGWGGGGQILISSRCKNFFPAHSTRKNPMGIPNLILACSSVKKC